jgi:hypothetical protein
VSRGGAILASLLATIGRPGWWLISLAGFLVRGGFILFVLPIVLLPSPLAISNALAPVIVPVALGRIGPDAIALFLGTVVVLSAGVLVGGWIAAATELVLIREEAAAAGEEGVGAPLSAEPIGSSDRVIVGKLLAARLVAWTPLALAIGIGIVGIISITYAELTRPAAVDMPLALRVALDAAPELAFIGVTWVLGELIGGLAARRIVLGGAPTGAALVGAAGEVVRRPGSTLLPWLITSGLLVAVVAGSVGAAGIAWSRVIAALSDRAVDSPTVVLNLLPFVAIWLAALILTGLCVAVRGAVQTFEYVHRQSVTGTFGASAHRRPGDWSVPDEGGSL